MQQPGPAIELQDLSRHFGMLRAVDGLSMTVARGSIFGLIGNNGAGKTTAIHTMMGFLPPTSGTVRVLGIDPSRDPVELRSRVGFFAERDEPYPWMKVRTLFQVARQCFGDWNQEECERYCAHWGIKPSVKMQDLSKGMMAKAKLIMSFARRPELLILDEPTSGLDPISRREVLTTLKDHARKNSTTALFSSHNLDEVDEIADTIGIISAGRLRFAASVESVHRMALISRPGPPPSDERIRARVLVERRIEGFWQGVVSDGLAESAALAEAGFQASNVSVKTLFLFLTESPTPVAA